MEVDGVVEFGVGEAQGVGQGEVVWEVELAVVEEVQVGVGG